MQPDNVNPTPAALGYAMPAEWEAHEATWLAWPHNRKDWPGKLVPIHWVYCEIVRKLAEGELVRILVRDNTHESFARRLLGKAGVPEDRVEFFQVPTDRGWTRDSGPIFLRNAEGRTVVVKFRFNAWAKYANWQRDQHIPERAAEALGKPLMQAAAPDGGDFVLEGGAVDVNGRGSLLTTEECMLSRTVQARNPRLDRDDTEQALRDNLGVRQVLWLGRGIAGDDTHGHVDDLARFVNPTTIVLVQEADPDDPNYRPLQENRERLHGMRLADGTRPTVVPLPSPAPLNFDGLRLPASYANFYIANAAVLVPTFNDPADRVALGTLAELFPDRAVVGIHAVDLVWGFGTLHCLTQQQPAETAADSP